MLRFRDIDFMHSFIEVFRHFLEKTLFLNMEEETYFSSNAVNSICTFAE